LLSSVADASSPVGLSNRQLELQRGVEQGLAAKAQVILAQALGERNSRVQISADLNFEQVDQTVETFDPDGQVIASEERSESEPGAVGGASGSSTIFHNTYLNSRRVDRVVGSVGGINRLTVAVLLNEVAMRESAAGTSVPEAVRMASLEALVRNAVGFDAGRGDQVTIVSVPFDSVIVADLADLVDEPTTMQILPLIERFLPQAIAILGILVSFVLALRTLRSVTAGTSPSTARAALPPSEEEYAALPRERSEVQQLKQQVVDQTNDLPNAAGQVVRAWLAEG
jgi:flagellar M-ring protein FliF